VLEDREAVRPRAGRRDHCRHELLLGQPEIARRARQAVPAQAGVDPGRQALVRAQVRREQARRARQLAVVGRAREQVVDRVQDLVVAAATRPARARRRHRQAGQHERLGERDQERVVVDPVVAVHERRGCDPRERHGHAVDRLATLARGQPPVGDRRQVAHRVADPGPPHRRLAAAHVVEVDHDRDRHLHAVGRLAARLVVLQGRDRGGDAVVRQRRRDRHHRQAGQAGGVLGHVDRAAAADPDDRVVEAGPQAHGEVGARLHRAARDAPDLAVLELRPQGGRDLLAEAGPDDHGHVAAAGDPPVGEQRAQTRDRSRPDVDRQRCADLAGQQRHATSRARARSSWSSTSTQSTAPIEAIPIRPPRSACSWKPSS
jgi:hypothetical protein